MLVLLGPSSKGREREQRERERERVSGREREGEGAATIQLSCKSAVLPRGCLKYSWCVGVTFRPGRVYQSIAEYCPRRSRVSADVAVALPA